MAQKQNITAIIYDKKGRVLSIGKNSYTKTHTLQHIHAKKAIQSNPELRRTHNVGMDFQHAEINAITKCRDLSKAYSISITRIAKDGSTALAMRVILIE
jgi:deoxycytidylate deaminase